MFDLPNVVSLGVLNETFSQTGAVKSLYMLVQFH